MEPVSEETEEAAPSDAVSASSAPNAVEKQSGKSGAGNFRVNMNVIVRVRPLQSHERREGSRGNFLAVKVVDKKMLVFDPADDASTSLGWSPRSNNNNNNRRKSVFPGGPLVRDHSARGRPHRDIRYAFDRVFDPQAANREIFDECVKTDVLDALLKGFNCSVFAYGATGAGKTFTMLGTQDNPGIMYRTVKELYTRIEGLKEEAEIKVQVTYIEIYNEEIKDLIQAADGRPSRPLKIWEDGSGEVTVGGVSFHTPQTAEHLLEMLEKGNRNRSQHPTDANQESSRSHAVFQIFLTRTEKAGGLSKDVIRAKMALVDLAGSERATMLSNNCGDRMREGANINRSLLALGNCINALADSSQRHKHVNFRDSNLTRLLKDSLGGNCRTVMIAAVSPAWLNSDDTHNTLNYANRAKNIRCDATRNVINVDSHVSEYADIVKRLKEENENLKTKIRRHEATNKANGNITNAARFGAPRSLKTLDVFGEADVKTLLGQVTDLRRKQLTLECGILDNEAKMNRKRKLAERKSLREDEEGETAEVEDLNAALEAIAERTEFMKSDRDGVVSRLRESHSSLASALTTAGVEDLHSHPQLQREMSQAASLDAARVQSFMAQQLAKQERLNDALHDLLLNTFRGFKERHNLLKAHGFVTERMEADFLSVANRFVGEERDIAFAATRREMALDDLDAKVRSEMMESASYATTTTTMERPRVSEESVNTFVALIERVRETSFSTLAAICAAAEASTASAASSVNSLVTSKSFATNNNNDKTVLKKKSSLKTHSNRRRSFSANAATSMTAPAPPGGAARQQRAMMMTMRNRVDNNHYDSARNNNNNNVDDDVNHSGVQQPKRRNGNYQNQSFKSPRQFCRKPTRVQVANEQNHHRAVRNDYVNDNNANNNNSNNNNNTPSLFRRQQSRRQAYSGGKRDDNRETPFRKRPFDDVAGDEDEWKEAQSRPRRLGTPGRTTPGRTTPGRTTPGRTTPGRATPGRTTPGRNARNGGGGFDRGVTPGKCADGAATNKGDFDFWASPSLNPPPPPLLSAPPSSGRRRSGGRRRGPRRVEGTPGLSRMTPAHRRWTPYDAQSSSTVNDGDAVVVVETVAKSSKDHLTKNLFPDSPTAWNVAESTNGVDSPGVLPLGASPILSRSETKSASQPRELAPPEMAPPADLPTANRNSKRGGGGGRRGRHRRSMTAPNADVSTAVPSSLATNSSGNQGRPTARVPFAPRVNVFNVAGGGVGGNAFPKQQQMQQQMQQQQRRMSRIPGPLDGLWKHPRLQQQQQQQPLHSNQHQNILQPQSSQQPHQESQQESQLSQIVASSLPSYMRPTAAAKKKRQSYIQRADGISLPVVDKEN